MHQPQTQQQHQQQAAGSAKDFTVLSYMLKYVYAPLESKKSNLQAQMENLSKAIHENIYKITQGVSINIPDIPSLPHNEIAQNAEVCQRFESSLAEWAENIKEHLKLAAEKQPELTAVGEIEFWRSKLAILSPLHEHFSVPEVKTIYSICKEAERNESMSLVSSADEFNKQRELLAKQYAEAKDNVKFLSTLDRQFKLLREGDLVKVLETLPSLMNGLKLVWKISRHILADHMKRILLSICNEISEKVEKEIKLKEIFNMPREEAIKKLEKAINCLSGWLDIYKRTKAEINSEISDKRWEFYTTELFPKIDYMLVVCQNLKEVSEEMLLFESTLSSNLKAVIGDPKKIDDMKEDLKSLTAPLESYPLDLFEAKFGPEWKSRFEKFKDFVVRLDSQISDIIKESFKKELKSAEGAFDLLQNFKSMTARPSITEAMKSHYMYLLDHFRNELERIEQLYDQKKEHPPIAKGKPPIAGRIAWMRSLYGRLKRPMFKFRKDRKELLKSEKGEKVFEKHKTFYDNKLSKDEEAAFDKWNSKTKEEGMQLIRLDILRKKERKPGDTSDGPPRYKVNFHYNLRMMIREAKNLERMGKPLNDTVKTISLQEEDYLKIVDQLKFFLKDYDEIVGSLKKVDFILLKRKVAELEAKIDYGMKELNWKSLGKIQFLKDCESMLKMLKKTKQEVGAYQNKIKDKVKKIKHAIIISPLDWSVKEPVELITLYSKLEEYRKGVINKLVEDYKSIGNEDLVKIEEHLFAGIDKKEAQEYMGEYYRFWEKKIFNSLINMTVQGLVTIYTMFGYKWSQLQQKAVTWKDTLFKIRVDYNHPAPVINPSEDDVEKRIKLILDLPLLCAKKFQRWAKGTCKLYEPKKKGIREVTDEDFSATFYPDLDMHLMIASLRKQLLDKVNNDIFRHLKDRTGNIIRSVEYAKNLWDSNNLKKLEKKLEKSPSCMLIDKKLSKLRKRKEDLEEELKVKTLKDCGPYKIDKTDFIVKVIQKLDERIKIIVDKVQDNEKKELKKINQEIEEYRAKLSLDPDSMETFKQLLKDIRAIKEVSLDMELKISNIQEKFAIIEAYYENIDESIKEAVDGLKKNWDELIDEASDKEDRMVNRKKAFAKETEAVVSQFNAEIQEYYKKFVARGPKSTKNTLDEGLEAMITAKEKLKDFNSRKEQHVLAEKLFGLPISSFPELKLMDEDCKEYESLFNLYDEYKKALKEYTNTPWLKFEVGALKKSCEEWLMRAKTLAKKKEDDVLCMNLVRELDGFSQMVNLLESLHSVSVQQWHWDKILHDIGAETDFNMKTGKVSQVLELKLQNYQDKLTEVLNQAAQEFRNEELLKGMEKTWREMTFKMVNKEEYENTPLIVSIDEIREKLDDCVMKLQNISGNKFGKAVKERVAIWQKNMNRISDVTDIWLKVQMKWVNLKIIFTQSTDIRQKLAEITNKFEQTNKKFKKIMDNTYKTLNVLQACKAEGRYDELISISQDLDKCQKALSTYLDSKRLEYPRFYFISEEEVLLIIGSTNPLDIQKRVSKMFANCKSLIFDNAKVICGMQSEEGEEYEFKKKQRPDDAVEKWMNKVDEAMVDTLHWKIKEAVFNYAKMDRIHWIKEHLGMITVVGSQIWWTFAMEDVFRRVREGDKHAMKKESFKQTKDLNDLIDLVRKTTDPRLYLKINTLLILDAHGRDIVDKFVRDSILDIKEFEWESQLRFYWDKPKDAIEIKQCSGVFSYGYEYQGLKERLVITPLTDRCIMTLTTALRFQLGGAPSGPAGTGKTETIKDLAKSMGYCCMVTNCNPKMDHKAMGTLFSGLAQTGFWGCFDEINRLSTEVLSVIASQIGAIQQALQAGKGRVSILDQNNIKLKDTIGIFVTMNPDYEGRSQLPDNLKMLFRPVTMVVPDSVLICEILLMSKGFLQAKQLAKKMIVLYDLSDQQLSKQKHYDFGLRAKKSVLGMAGKIKAANDKESEEIILMRAMRDMNIPKFVFEDVPLFEGLVKDLFPKIEIKADLYGKMKEKIEQEMEEKKLKLKDRDDPVYTEQVKKVIQLYETMDTRHSSIVVGPTGGGKSTIISLLANTLESWKGRKIKREVINPKSIDLDALYGRLQITTREWENGLLSKIFRSCNEDPRVGEEYRWILFDGDVDPVWVENMNSVMDDSKLLTLPNGDRIKLEPFCLLLFEVGNLARASPATVSRNGMVWMDPKNLGYKPFYDKWIHEKPRKDSEIIEEYLNRLFDKFVKPCIDYIFEGKEDKEIVDKPLQLVSNQTNLNMVKQLCTLMDILFPRDSIADDYDHIENIFIFALIWSLGACINDREKFDKYVHKIAQRSSLPVGSLYEHQYLVDRKRWEIFDVNRDSSFIPDDVGQFSKVWVPTIDTTRYLYLLKILLKQENLAPGSQGPPVMLIGESGTAKSVIMQHFFSGLLSDKETMDKYLVLNINFSSRTNSEQLQKTLRENLDPQGKRLAPPGNKIMIAFIDDLNMPKIDFYGTQQPIAFLKFLIERGEWYERTGELELKKINVSYYAGAMTPPGGGNNSVDPRFLSLFNCFYITHPSKDSLFIIYNTILRSFLKEYNIDVLEKVPRITEMSLDLYNAIKSRLTRTPIKFHYVFTMRDMSKLYEGVCQVKAGKFEDIPQIIRLWRHESLRVFVDRLMSENDKKIVRDELIPNAIKERFPECYDESMKTPILMGDFFDIDPLNPGETERQYKDLVDYDTVRPKLAKIMDDMNNPKIILNLVLFDEAIEHMMRVHRIIRLQRGHALLVGYGGSGRQSIARLASFTAAYKWFGIQLTKNYGEKEFKEDLKALYKLLVKTEYTFFFTDSHVADESFLEFINNILTIGIVPAMFTEDEKDTYTNPIKEEASKMGADTKDAVWNYFINKCRDNLHIVLSMSPAGDTLRIRCRNFPGLLSNTTIDWFFPWPEEALKSVATSGIKDEQLPSDQKEPIIKHLVHTHMSAQKYCEEFEAQYKRHTTVTPKAFLDYIATYKKLMKEMKHKMDQNINRFEGGLVTLVKANDDIKILNVELEKHNKIVTAEREKCNEILREINDKTKTVDQQKKDAVEKRKKLSVESKEIAIKKADADQMLAKAKPALEAAAAQLDTLTNEHMGYIKAMQKPKIIIIQVLYLAHILLNPHATYDWTEVKSKMLSNANLLKDFKEKTSEKGRDTFTDPQMKKIKSELKKFIESTPGCKDFSDFLVIVGQTFDPLRTVLDFVDKVVTYYDTAKAVKPLRIEVEKRTTQLNILQADLKDTEANIEKLEKLLEELNQNRIIREKELAIHTEKAAQMQRRLDSANRLINGLSSIQARWKKEAQDLKITINKLIGDCLLCASFLTYAGPFNQEYRMKMVYDDWYKSISENKISCSEGLTVQMRLTDDVEKATWVSEGLPPDELSVQNGILITRAIRFPMCIDPQMQAVRWIKRKEENLDILTFKRPDYIKRLLSAITFGKSVLFEGVDEQLDPRIDPVLEKSYVVEAQQKYFKFGEDKIEWADSFKVFLTTMIANPKFTPETMNRTLIINFNVTAQGLKEQLLNEVVGFEKPELETERRKLVIQTSENKKKLKVLEDNLLKGLTTSTGALVDNLPLIDTLETTRNTAESIEKDLEEAAKNQESITASRNQYLPVATLGATLFFAMFCLSAVSPMYEYSLGSYTEVFCKALSEAKRDSIPQNRIMNMKKEVQKAVYNYTTTGIFECHKLMFSFHMTTMIMAQENELDRTEFDFFLKGNTSIEELAAKKPPVLSWLSDQGWKDLQKLITLEATWSSLSDDMTSNAEAWKVWYDDERPEAKSFPGEWQGKLNSFQKLLVVRVIRPDRIVYAIKDFIVEKHGYVDPPVLKYSTVFQQSNEKSPILFILSPGADPSAELAKFAAIKGFANKFRALPLGKDDTTAQSMIDGGVVKGHWVMLQNCHLVVNWLKDLEAIIDDKMSKPHQDFRLWLTSSPTLPGQFPIGILQRSLKVVIEPPEGLRQNMKTLYEKLNDQRLTECKHPKFKDLVYVVSFYHAILQDRKKFGKIGWNVQYGFNESDFIISLDLLSMYLTKALVAKEDTIPWSTLTYLIGEAMYGGRVTDDFDRRVLMTYLHEYMGDFLFDRNQPFYFSKIGYDFNIPSCENHENYCKSLDQLPQDCSPEVFGLHPNSQIISNTNKAKEIWVDMLKMQTSRVENIKGVNKDEKIEQTAKDILSKLQPQFDLLKVREKLLGATTPTQAVLMQELERFNILTAQIQSSLTLIIMAIKGEIAMSSELDELANFLFNGFLPNSWRELAPLTEKKLASWIAHYMNRLEQYKAWIEKGEPIVMWISGLHVPESYLSALVQIACRAKGWALDKSTKITEVTTWINPSDVKEKADIGSFISGLYMEGSRWDSTQNCVMKQNPKELCCEMPVIKIIPVETNKVKLRDKLITPVYVTQARRNPRGDGLVFEAQLNTKEHPSHWILQGVCLVLNIDQDEKI